MASSIDRKTMLSSPSKGDQVMKGISRIRPSAEAREQAILRLESKYGAKGQRRDNGDVLFMVGKGRHEKRMRASSSQIDRLADSIQRGTVPYRDELELTPAQKTKSIKYKRDSGKRVR
jgi:hypothetical protein